MPRQCFNLQFERNIYSFRFFQNAGQSYMTTEYIYTGIYISSCFQDGDFVLKKKKFLQYYEEQDIQIQIRT